MLLYPAKSHPYSLDTLIKRYLCSHGRASRLNRNTLIYRRDAPAGSREPLAESLRRPCRNDPLSHMRDASYTAHYARALEGSPDLARREIRIAGNPTQRGLLPAFLARNLVWFRAHWRTNTKRETAERLRRVPPPPLVPLLRETHELRLILKPFVSALSAVKTLEESQQNDDAGPHAGNSNRDEV